MCLLSSHQEQIWFWLGAYTLSADQCYCGGLSVFCFVLFFVFFVRGSCGHCNHWIGQLCVQSSVCRLGGSIVILNSLVAFFPGFHALRGESFSWRVANVNVNKQCFHLTGSLNSRSDALSGLHRVFFQQFSPGGSCPPHYGAFSPGLAKLKDQARAWFFRR